MLGRAAHLLENGVLGFLVQAKVRARRLGAAKDDVLHLLHVDLGGAEDVENAGESADPVLVAYHQQMSGGSLARQVDAVRHVPFAQKAAGNTEHFLGHRVLGLGGGGTDMVGALHAGYGEDARVEAPFSAGRLALENVERCPQPTGLDFAG